jgi:biuret amidohydrolase
MEKMDRSILMKTALLVVDVQQIYTEPSSAMYCKQADKTITNINKLIEAFETAGDPVFLIRHIHKADGSDLGRMFDFAGPAEGFNFKAGTKEVNFSSGLVRPKGAIEFVKTRYSSFAGTNLNQTLKNISVGRVVICGFMTNFCCDSTARDAHDLDYFVDFVVDATGTPGTADLNQSKIRQVVAVLLAEGYAEVFSTKNYLKKIGSLSR